MPNISIYLNQYNISLAGKTIESAVDLFTQPATEGSKTSLYLALSDEGGQITGKYWYGSKIDKPSELSTNLDLAEQLVAKCQQLTKI